MNSKTHRSLSDRRSLTKLLTSLAFFAFTILGCSGQRTNPNTQGVSTFSSYEPGPNILRIDVGAACGGYINEPCVSITVCEPGTDNCEEIPRLLLDTGSYGLRIFSSALTLKLPDKSLPNGKLAECVGYLDGTSHWGPVKMADLKMSQEKALSVPIQVIDSTYGPIPPDCQDLESNPSEAGYNGILGIGNLIQDCGGTCETTANNRIYFICSSDTCSPTSVAARDQVSNPVDHLTTDSNGVIIDLPSLPPEGAKAAIGSLILGINTRDNNSFQNVQSLSADGLGNFRTRFNSMVYASAFIDSGSNGLFFPRLASLPDCMNSADLSGFYCPQNPVDLSATQIGHLGTPEIQVPFQVANANSLTSSKEAWAFNNLGGVYGSGFDWGLPFFFGRRVHVGLEGHSSLLGNGPYWGY